MKISKNKSKGKVHPSPINSNNNNLSSSSSSSSCSFSTCKDASSTLKLLPVTILTLISVLSPAEREVFAYMITRSIKATSNPSSLLEDSLIRSSRKSSSFRKSSSEAPPHVPPVFDCGCFDCYTSYWFRWDSSPNRELIHQAIEAFEEEHLSAGDQQQRKKSSSTSSGGRGKSRRERVSCRAAGHSAVIKRDDNTAESHQEVVVSQISPVVEYPLVEEGLVVVAGEGSSSRVEDEVEAEAVELEKAKEEEEAERTDAAGQKAAGGGGGGNHKGLARKVLPDVIGLFNSRMWSLWSPNV